MGEFIVWCSYETWPELCFNVCVCANLYVRLWNRCALDRARRKLHSIWHSSCMKTSMSMSTCPLFSGRHECDWKCRSNHPILSMLRFQPRYLHIANKCMCMSIRLCLYVCMYVHTYGMHSMWIDGSGADLKLLLTLLSVIILRHSYYHQSDIYCGSKCNWHWPDGFHDFTGKLVQNLLRTIWPVSMNLQVAAHILQVYSCAHQDMFRI